MTPHEAINILAQATEPGVQLSRANYVHIDAALLVLKPIVDEYMQPCGTMTPTAPPGAP